MKRFTVPLIVDNRSSIIDQHDHNGHHSNMAREECVTQLWQAYWRICSACYVLC